MTAVAVAVDIYCHRCARQIGRRPAPLELVGLVRGSAPVRVEGEVERLRCRRCGWVNLFRTIAEPRADS